MESTPQQKWERCLNFIRQNIDEKPYETWFSSILFKRIKERVITIQVPTHFVREFIDETYGRLLQSAIAREFGEGFKWDYFVKDPNAPETSLDQKSQANPPHPTGRGGLGNKAPDVLQSLAVQKPADWNSQLNPRYTFENFIEGDCNKLSRSVGLSIANDPTQVTFNPLFIYGSSGVGKTHLVNAIGNSIEQHFPDKRVLYVSAHLFLVQYTDSVRHNTFNDFINFYQTIDVLIIDDIQEIAGSTKVRTQQAFFHIFNHLQQNRKQLIMTCDRPPVVLEGLEERLLTRFKWGLIAELEKPDAKLRETILKNKIYADGLKFPANVVQYIAANATDNIRDLEGIVNSIMAYSIVYDCDINMELAERVVVRSVNLEKKPITVEMILDKVGAHYKLSNKEICSSSRKQPVAQARQIAMYLSQKHTGLSYARIGNSIGRRDHSTVLYSCNLIEKRICVDKIFRRELTDIEQSLQQD